MYYTKEELKFVLDFEWKKKNFPESLCSDEKERYRAIENKARLLREKEDHCLMLKKQLELKERTTIALEKIAANEKFKLDLISGEYVIPFSNGKSHW